jgi:four helix bundle protein
MVLRPYEQLIVWQKSHKLCLRIYDLTKKFPKEEQYGLVSQMRRSSYSVPTNIAEGNARRFTKDKARFFEIGLASLEELHYQCRLSLDLHYITQSEFEEVVEMIRSVSYLLTKLRMQFIYKKQKSSISPIASITP